MTPAQAHHRRRIRTILVFRASAVICVALALPIAGRGISMVMASPGFRLVISDETYAWTGRLLILLGRPTWPEAYRWLVRHGLAPLLLALAAYLWLRRPHLLVRPSPPEARP